MTKSAGGVLGGNGIVFGMVGTALGLVTIISLAHAAFGQKQTTGGGSGGGTGGGGGGTTSAGKQVDDHLVTWSWTTGDQSAFQGIKWPSVSKVRLFHLIPVIPATPTDPTQWTGSLGYDGTTFPVDSVISTIKANNTKVLISFVGGGAVFDAFNNRVFADQTFQQKVISNLIAELKARNADGVSIDIENFSATNTINGTSNKANMVAFLKNLSAALKSALPGKTITVDVPFRDFDGVWDIASIEPYVDFVSAMEYDLPGSTFYTLTQIKQWVDGWGNQLQNKAKLLWGMAPDQYTTSGGSQLFTQCCQALNASPYGGLSIWDNRVFIATPGYWTQIQANIPTVAK